jgi:flavin reductase (DIM6/NTAB) family NADH-FMN oxidoreductase RutF
MTQTFETSDAHPTLVLRKAFSMFPTGVVAVCALDDGVPVGMAVNSFSSVSLEPPLVSVCVAHTSSTWPRLKTSPNIGLSVLGADQEGLSRKLSARSGDRFEGVQWTANEDGALFIDGATLWLDCRVRDQLRGGDHEIILFEVLQSHLFPQVPPLVFHQSRYLGLAHAP